MESGADPGTGGGPVDDTAAAAVAGDDTAALAATRRAVAAAVIEVLDRLPDQAPDVSDATRAMLRARAAQVDEIRDAIHAGAPAAAGYRSPTAWLAATTHEPAGVCRRTVAMAMRLPDLPATHAAFRDGELAEAAVHLLCAAWTPAVAEAFAADEPMLVDWARRLPYADFKQVLDRWRMYTDPDREHDEHSDRFERRRLHLSPLLDDMWALDGLLDPDGAGLLDKAIKAMTNRTPLDGRTPAQARADGLVGMAKFVLDHLQPQPGQKRSRHKVNATATLDDMMHRHGGGAVGYGASSTVTTINRIRAMACDCDFHRLLLGPDGRIIDYGRATRTVPDHLFDLLVIRDHGCRFPGCGVAATACDAHHAIHWLGPDGQRGDTEPDNLMLACWYHHHLLHDQHWSTTPVGAGHFQLTDPTGRTHTIRPPMIGATPPGPPPAATAVTPHSQRPPAA